MACLARRWAVLLPSLRVNKEFQALNLGVQDLTPAMRCWTWTAACCQTQPKSQIPSKNCANLSNLCFGLSNNLLESTFSYLLPYYSIWWIWISLILFFLSPFISSFWESPFSLFWSTLLFRFNYCFLSFYFNILESTFSYLLPNYTLFGEMKIGLMENIEKNHG